MDNQAWEQCPSCDSQFQPWAFPNQKFPFRSCKTCRDKKKAEGGYNNTSPAQPLVSNTAVLDALRTVYEKLEGIHTDIKSLKN